MSKKLKVLIIINYIVLALIFFIDICACVYFVKGNPTEDIFEENILKVVEIKVSDDNETYGYATGCFIDNSGTILTNKHVVLNSSSNENFSHVYVRLATQEEFTEAQILKVSENDDLALVKVDWKDTKYYEFESSILNGETIYTFGNPNGFGLSFSQGVISSSSRNVIYNETTINTVQTSLVINEGNSGGPVFNKNGKLVGLISFRLKDKNNDIIQGCSFAIPVSTIKNFIQ